MIYSHSCSQTKRLIKLYLSNEVIRSILLIKTCSPPNRSIEGLEKYFYIHKIFSQENVTSWKNLPVSSSNELPTVDESFTGRWRGASLEGITFQASRFRFFGFPLYSCMCPLPPQCPLKWQNKWEGPEEPMQYLRAVVTRALAIQVHAVQGAGLIDRSIDR